MARVARNAGYTKEFNRKLLLRLLRARPMSRAEAARETGLTRAWTSLIADELLADGILEERELQSAQRGRAPTPLAVRSDAYYAACASLSRTGSRIGIVNIGGSVAASERLRLDGERTSLGMLEALAASLEAMIRSAGIPRERLLGVGVSAPGPLDAEEGRILNPPLFDLWHGAEVTPILSGRLGMPVYLANLATALTVYCHERPESQGSHDFLLLYVDSGGVGSGVISQGKLLQSAGHFTSEIGHMSIDFNGRPCPCGNTGCLEMYASMPHILAEFGMRRASWREVVDGGDGEIIAREAEYLAAGIVNAANFVNVDSVLLAGDVLYGFDRLAEEIGRRVNGRVLARGKAPIRILPAADGPDLDLLDTGDIVFSRFLQV